MYRVDLETGEAEAILTRRAWIRYARLSPDGKRIVFAMPHETQDYYGGSIYTLPAEPGATPVLLRHEPTEQFDGPSWSPDGRLVAFVSVSINQKEKIGRVLVTPVDGGEPKEVARHTLEEGGSIEFTAWSPSGTHILYSLQREAWRVSAQGGEPEHLVELDEFNPHHFIFTADGKTLLFTGTQGGSNPRAWALKNFLPDSADDASGQ